MFSVNSYTVLQSVLAPPLVVTFHEQFQWIGGYTSTVEGLVVAFYCNEGLTPEKANECILC